MGSSRPGGSEASRQRRSSWLEAFDPPRRVLEPINRTTPTVLANGYSIFRPTATNEATSEDDSSELVFPYGNDSGPSVKGLGGGEASSHLLLRCLDASHPPRPCEPLNITVLARNDL